ncbi:MAG: hypothetical protein U0X91_30645 [Spirosomataceae bacterium]
MSKTENSVLFAYTEKLREQQARIEALEAKVNAVKGLVNSYLPTDDKLMVLHKIKLVLK